MDPVKELIDILHFAFAFQKGLDAALEDRKLNAWDVPKFVPAASALPAAVMGADGVLELYEEFTNDQKQRVYAFVDENYEIESDSIKEKLIKETIKEIVGDFQVLVKWRNYLKGRKAA